MSTYCSVFCIRLSAWLPTGPTGCVGCRIWVLFMLWFAGLKDLQKDPLLIHPCSLPLRIYSTLPILILLIPEDEWIQLPARPQPQGFITQSKNQSATIMPPSLFNQNVSAYAFLLLYIGIVFSLVQEGSGFVFQGRWKALQWMLWSIQ